MDEWKCTFNENRLQFQYLNWIKRTKTSRENGLILLKLNKCVELLIVCSCLK